jgi:hypothetical protein
VTDGTTLLIALIKKWKDSNRYPIYELKPSYELKSEQAIRSVLVSAIGDVERNGKEGKRWPKKPRLDDSPDGRSKSTISLFCEVLGVNYDDFPAWVASNCMVVRKPSYGV